MMPKELIRMHSRTSDNDPICFNFNLGKCTRRMDGGRCEKGFHICCKYLKEDHSLGDNKC